MPVPEISVQELKSLRDSGADFVLLDVRNADEYAFCNIGGRLLPYKDLPNHISEFHPDQHIVIHCHGGGRSGRATEFLIQQGFTKVYNLRGGITAWAKEIDTSMPTY